MPLSLCELKNLQILNVFGNKLQTLPENFGKLSSLKQLDVRENIKLKELPKNICYAQRLKDIKLDYEQFIYPPSVVAKNGTQEILIYICKGIGSSS